LFTIAFLTLMMQPVSLKAGQDVNTAKFWLPHCQKADMACIGYLQALLDMNNLERENGVAVKWCAPNVLRLDDLRLTIIRELKAKPEQLSLPFITLATNALITAYPCLDDVLK
jgi:hypothetical protein